jgi:hypothetical protein
MISKYIITNSWTQAWHGHAHDELSSIKQLLSKWSIDTCILSVDSKFGDRHIPSFGLTLQRLRLDHSKDVGGFSKVEGFGKRNNEIDC